MCAGDVPRGVVQVRCTVSACSWYVGRVLCTVACVVRVYGRVLCTVVCVERAMGAYMACVQVRPFRFVPSVRYGPQCPSSEISVCRPIALSEISKGAPYIRCMETEYGPLNVWRFHYDVHMK